MTNVLAVDDDGFMRGLLDRVLTGAGMHVVTHGSAAALLEDAGLRSADVLLLDVKLPDMSGLELQELLLQRGVDVPVVFISGVADLETAVTAMRKGAADFIEKPFDSASLIERIHRAVARLGQRSRSLETPPDPLFLARLASLTPRERSVFDLIITGKSSKVIARELGGSFRTIELHRARVMDKMSVRHLAELVRLSIASQAPH